MPPLYTAVHPSYLNRHALHGIMKAQCVSDAVPQMLKPMLRLARRIWENAEVGGFHFPSDAPPAQSPVLQEAIHVDVSQHRTDNATLRSTAAAASSAAHASLAIITPLLDRRLEPHLDEAQDIPIDDAPSNRLHQFSVRDRVEVSGQIRVHHMSVAAADQRMDFLDRV